MNDKTRRHLESGQSCRQWSLDYVVFIPAGSMFETKFQLLTTCVNGLEDLAAQLAAFVGEGLSATDVKSSERLDLLAIMERVRNAARSAESDHPGTRDRYRYTTTMSAQALLAAGRGFAAGGVDDQSLLADYGAPSHWPADVTAACDAYEATFGVQDSAQGGRVGINAAINEQLGVLKGLKSTISHMVPNFCSGNTAAIAAWTSAAHVQEAPSKDKDDDPPPTP